jgi:hypothetical protein
VPADTGQMSDDSKRGALAALGHKLVHVLPPAFLALLLMNAAFIGIAAWLVSRAAETRNAMLTRIIENCLLRSP